MTELDTAVGEIVKRSRNGSAPPPEREPMSTRLADVRPERVRWLWPGRIPFGKLTVLDGDPGLGKSTLIGADIAARVSTGSPMPDGHRLEGPAGVVLMSAEDGTADTIRPRLEAAGANLERIGHFDGVIGDEGIQLPSLPGDAELLKRLIVDYEAVLVVVDPFMAYLHGSINSYRDQDVRRAMHPMSRLAEETGAAVVLVRHLNKGGAANVLYRGGGSIGLIGAARAGLVVAPDPDDQTGTRRVLAVSKCNLHAPVTALAYRLVGDDEHDCGRIVWDGPTGHSAAQLLALPTGDDDERSAVEDAADFLRQMLAEGPVASKAVQAEARNQGHAPITLRRAKERLGIKPRKLGLNLGWVWDLPEDAQVSTLEQPEDAHLSGMNAFGSNEHLRADLA